MAIDPERQYEEPTVTCPACNAERTVEQYAAVPRNRFVRFTDTNPLRVGKVRRRNDARGAKLLRRAVAGSDGVRRLAFYVDHRYEHADLARWLVKRHKWPQTRSHFLSELQRYLEREGPIKPLHPEDPVLRDGSLLSASKYVEMLFPDLKPGYGKPYTSMPIPRELLSDETQDKA